MVRREWVKTLSGKPGEAFKVSWDRCKDSHPKFPPTPGEFRKLMRVEAYHKPFPEQKQLEGPHNNSSYRRKKLLNAWLESGHPDLVARAKEKLK